MATSTEMKTLLVVCVVLLAGMCPAQRIVRHKLGGIRKIEFQQDTTAPVSAITSPANNATVNGTISVTATSSDNVGVVKLELYVDAGLYATILTPASPAAQWTVAGATLNCPSPGCGSFPNFIPPNGSPSGIGGAGGE
jgi:hypothetical protein